MTSLQDKLMTELGYISMSCSNFDYLINEINASLINLDNHHIGINISSELNTHSRIKMYNKLLEIIPLPKELVLKAKTNLKEFTKAKEKRNEFIHGIWHTKWENEVHLDDLYISKLNSSWSSAKKVDVEELKEIKETLQSLMSKQLQINVDILTTYRHLIDDDLKNKKKITAILKKSMESVDLDDIDAS